jgi:predicted site-specific integrase-resolvase
VTPRPLDELHAALDRGEWLQINDVAIVLGISRQTVHRMVVAGMIRHRPRIGTGNQRELSPDDVRQQLAKRDQVTGGESPQA